MSLHTIRDLRLDDSLLAGGLVELVIVQFLCLLLINAIKLCVVVLEFLLLSLWYSIRWHLYWLESLFGCLLSYRLFERIHGCFAIFATCIFVARHGIVRLKRI